MLTTLRREEHTNLGDREASDGFQPLAHEVVSAEALRLARDGELYRTARG